MLKKPIGIHVEVHIASRRNSQRKIYIWECQYIHSNTKRMGSISKEERRGPWTNLGEILFTQWVEEEEIV